MLIVSDQLSEAFLNEGLAQLRQRIVNGWKRNFAQAATLVEVEGRNQILAEIDAQAREDRSLTVEDLNIMADLKLTAMAGQIRRSQK